MDKSRAPLKALRDAENELAPRRNIRVSLETQIGRIEYDQPKNQERRLAELKQQLQTAEAEDAQAEREIELHKRKALRACEQLKWAAIREVGIRRMDPVLLLFLLISVLRSLVWRETCLTCRGVNSNHRCSSFYPTDCNTTL